MDIKAYQNTFEFTCIPKKDLVLSYYNSCFILLTYQWRSRIKACNIHSKNLRKLQQSLFYLTFLFHCTHGFTTAGAGLALALFSVSFKILRDIYDTQSTFNTQNKSTPSRHRIVQYVQNMQWRRKNGLTITSPLKCTRIWHYYNAITSCYINFFAKMRYMCKIFTDSVM